MEPCGTPCSSPWQVSDLGALISGFTFPRVFSRFSRSACLLARLFFHILQRGSEIRPQAIDGGQNSTSRWCSVSHRAFGRLRSLLMDRSSALQSDEADRAWGLLSRLSSRLPALNDEAVPRPRVRLQWGCENERTGGFLILVSVWSFCWWLEVLCGWMSDERQIVEDMNAMVLEVVPEWCCETPVAPVAHAQTFIHQV